MTGIEDPTSVYEINGRKITRVIRHLAVRFSSFNFTVEFYRSTFLVKTSQRPKGAPKWVKTVLNLDLMDDISEEWVDSDVLIFNTGHWWKHTKLFDSGLYFQVGDRLKLGMSIPEAFNMALSTWKSWVESNINTSRTHVLFRTFESDHWGTGFCEVTRLPMSRVEGLDQHPYSDAILDLTKNLSVPVTVLHVTPMTAFRSDAHVGTWGDNPSIRDCAHWCLPGVPDMWNEFIFSNLFSSHIKS
ncbi:OLC1v1016575C1 [Oldenlandia corymbosa var. corymbosa]|uniref:OLC1v1016575C1 n=1 Tax=Oldenlandia corymbosa var. corymbosa TaxID=529605 RepID=A0AAV1E746_OLDCO|nr:OLC1v1016575C1 [Oldenlandia corymbosa var. corymbosa]